MLNSCPLHNFDLFRIPDHAVLFDFGAGMSNGFHQGKSKVFI